MGRFRKFVDAVAASQGNLPAQGAGAHPLIPNSGWDVNWNNAVLTSIPPIPPMVFPQSCNYPTWTSTPGTHEDLPVNCVNWYSAFAFCVWDGGRLPTEAESHFTASGGNEQRIYAWGSAIPTFDYALYECAPQLPSYPSCSVDDILRVGSKSPKGDGKFGQVDLAGSMWEWNLDFNAVYPVPCADCANLTDSGIRVARGGTWKYYASTLPATERAGFIPTYREDAIGFRCARTL